MENHSEEGFNDQLRMASIATFAAPVNQGRLRKSALTIMPPYRIMNPAGQALDLAIQRERQC